MESLVIVDQDATVNLYLDLVHTARHMLGVCFTRNLQRKKIDRLILSVVIIKGFFYIFANYGEMCNWDEVVTR
jgi:presenilin-like A22 family membrane protease